MNRRPPEPHSGSNSIKVRQIAVFSRCSGRACRTLDAEMPDCAGQNYPRNHPTQRGGQQSHRSSERSQGILAEYFRLRLVHEFPRSGGEQQECFQRLHQLRYLGREERRGGTCRARTLGPLILRSAPGSGPPPGAGFAGSTMPLRAESSVQAASLDLVIRRIRK